MNTTSCLHSAAKISQFSKHTTIQCRGKLISIDQPLVMGILNVTPDSFYDGGKYRSSQDAANAAATMYEQGAAMVDIGAASTRPGANAVPTGLELDRLLPVVEAVRRANPNALISVDTYRSTVARQAVAAGADMVNDISGGDLDKDMFHTVAELQVPYVLMHMQGTPDRMQDDPLYDDVTHEVLACLIAKLNKIRSMGVKDVMIDPGFGFGKTIQHNYTLLRELSVFQILQLPLLVGLSRKSMIWKALGLSPAESLPATSLLHYQALLNGASILRVHDVAEAVNTIQLFHWLTEEKSQPVI